jgi:hypothetical protein
MSKEDNLTQLLAWKAAAKPIVVSTTEYFPGCTGKVKHPTKDAAIQSVKMKKGTETYLCPHCYSWHSDTSKAKDKVKK